MEKDKYYRYQMTYPYESTKIYKSKDFDKVVKKCYNHYKNFDGMEYGMFCVTNLDKNIEYKFQVNQNKISKIENRNIEKYNHEGGQISSSSKETYDDLDKNQDIFCEITVDDMSLEKKEPSNCIII